MLHPPMLRRLVPTVCVGALLVSGLAHFLTPFGFAGMRFADPEAPQPGWVEYLAFLATAGAMPFAISLVAFGLAGYIMAQGFGPPEDEGPPPDGPIES